MKFTIITPSYNQGVYIGETIESVLSQQGAFELEYWVVDGGSTDSTLEVLRGYGPRLQWVSEPDRGQSDAINKGLRRATGDVVAWLNSDDVYEPGALAAVADGYRRTPFVWAFGDCRIIDGLGREIRQAVTRYKRAQSARYSLKRLLRRDFISQPAVFWSAEAFRTIGPINEALVYSMDYDYWLRLARQTDPVYMPRVLASFRWHDTSKNGSMYRRAAWETFRTACRHARPGEKSNLAMHFAHYLTLSIVYRFL